MDIIVITSSVGTLSEHREVPVRDQWVTARAEGRTAINCGLGFGQMGHKVDIHNLLFDNVQVNENVRFINKVPEGKYYDIAYSVRTALYRGPCGRQLNSITPENHNSVYAAEMKDKFPNIEFYANNYLIMDTFSGDDMQVERNMLPYLYPIPTLPGLKEQGFIPPSWDKDKKEQKVFIYNGRIPWNGYENTLKILRRLKNHYNYDLKVYKLTNLRGPLQIEQWNGIVPFEDEILREFDVTVVDSWKQSYSDIITLLREMDICITKGDPNAPGNCAYDIISLGKLFFYTTSGCWESTAINEQFKVTWSINEESDKDNIDSKIDSVIANPKKSVEDFQESIVHYSYPVWKGLMEKVLNKGEGV